jgi:GT2 family glycosyltransferase/SAM-dependent methyltransferase
VINQLLDTRFDPRVTIVVPCFKQEIFLFECLNSLVAQTMPAWEAFVIDDYSPALTAARIVSAYNDPRILCIRHDRNLGPASAKNTGLQAGHAPFAVYVDADDFLHPEFLSATLDAIEGQGVDCAYTQYQFVGLSSEVGFADKPKSAGELAKEQWLPGGGVTMRRSVWEAVGGYSTDLRYNEDWDFWIAALQLGVSVAHVPRPLYFYRRHSYSLTATQADKDWLTREVILKKHTAFFAVGDRARAFRTGGLVASAHAHRTLRHRWQSVKLIAHAVTIDPKLIFSECKPAIRRILRRTRLIEQKLMSKIGKIRQEQLPNSKMNSPNQPETNLSGDWDSHALVVHNRYGHLSHDFSVLGDVIGKIKARCVLEIGCGSGRLVPVYLAHNVQTIWLQDVSERALGLCHQRFFCQKHIRYLHGNVQSISVSARADLIVANRVLQHIVEDGEFNDVINYLKSITRYFYINECGIEDGIRLRDPYLKGRDYVQIFRDLGWQVADRGELTAEDGTRQRWMLFAAREMVDYPASPAQQLGVLDVEHPK